jgi:peptide/nickel transport system ATP-binding protein
LSVTSDRPRSSVPDASVPRAQHVAEVANLHVTFRRAGRDIRALRGVSLDVRAGEILGLVGESGSGKSVLGMTMLGLLPTDPAPSTAGTVTVCGEDVLGGSAELRRSVRRRHLGAVFQDPMTSLNPTMRVGRQVIERAGSPDEAIRLLRAVGIPDPGRRMACYPHELSGGLRQRVMIAMAVAGSPALVVADEPTTALDVMVQAQVLALLRSLCDRTGCSFLLITHDLGVAAQIADRVAVIYAGRLAELGPTGSVLRAAAHPYSTVLIRSRLTLTAERGRPLTTLPGEVPDAATPPPGCAFQPRCHLAVDRCGVRLPEPVAVAPEHLSACILPVSEVIRAPGPPPPHGPPGGGRARPTGGQLAAGVRGLHKSFRVRSGRGRGSLAALSGVELRVHDGESVAIVGESGSGKSTLLRAIAGLERADSGEIALGPGARPQMVFQDAGASLTPWLTVGALVGERLLREALPAAARRERVHEALAHVGLTAEVVAARASQLSGGQRQRVALARAIVVPPEVLLCDEPTSALDVSLAAVIINLIARLRRELGMAVVFVTHDLAVARVVADRIAVMYLGRIVELGTAEEVVRQPRHPYTRALVGAVPDFGVRPAPAAGEPASPLSPPPGCAFHPRCPIAEPACGAAGWVPVLTPLAGAPHREVACVRAEAV